MSDAFAKSVDTKKQASKQPGKIGFAFGGLAGFNAHNAGVLQAMLDSRLSPDVITCTSGAIWWVAQYLQGKNLRELMRNQANVMKGISGLTLPFTGLPGVFRPAVLEYFARFWKPWPAEAMRFFADPFKIPELYEFFQTPPITELLNRLLPAESYEPTRPDKEFDDILNSFQAESAPAILFNAYDVENGWEVVYCNQKAYDLLKIDKRPFRNQHTQERGSQPAADSDIPQTEYRLLKTIQDIKDALWLFWYGMKNHRQIDGAYRRQVMLSELTMCERIYVVKPQPCGIDPGNMPTNYFGIQDFQTEIWMNSSYDSQVAELSNHAARHAYKRALKAAGKSLPTPVPMDDPATITLVPISRKKPLGYFNYFVEQLDNFNDAHEQALGDFNASFDLAYLGARSDIKATKALPSVQIFSEL